MYPPSIVYVATYYDHVAGQQVTKVFSKSEDAHFHVGLRATGDNYTIREARFVL